MRIARATTAAVSLLVPWAAALIGPLPQHDNAQSSSRRMIATRLFTGGMGWDNENFLEALGRGPEEIDKANEEYRSLSRFRPEAMAPPPGSDDDDDAVFTPAQPDDVPTSEDNPVGAELTKDMIEQVKASHNEEEEASQGGQMFRNLMAKAKDGGNRGPPPQQYQPPPPPRDAAAAYPPPPQQPVMPPPGTDPNSLSVEQQAEMFRQMMAQQQQAQPGAYPSPLQQQQAPPPPPQNFNPPGLGGDGKRIGRNRDADTIVNTADVYFAQLKRDSTLRNYARYRGDDDTANAVFADPSIHEIELHENPYLEEQRKQEQAMLETTQDEMLELAFRQSDSREHKDKSYSGIHYKEKLKARKRSKGGAAAPAAPVAEPADPEPVVQPVASTPPPPAAATAPPAPVSSGTSDTATSSKQKPPKTTMMNRQDMRTLMGLLLKHRGGPGFGAGRLSRDAEIERFESLAGDLIDVLEHEAATLPPPAPEPKAEKAAPAAAVTPSGDRVSGMLSLMEGAIQMYQNAPASLQPSVLVTLRAALVTAATTLGEIMGTSAANLPDAAAAGMMPITPPPTSLSEADAAKVTSTTSLLQGAMQMYRNSPPGPLQDGVLVTLQSALVSGILTLDNVIGGGAVAPTAAVAPPAPVQEAPPPPVPQEAPETQPLKPVFQEALEDENSAFFQTVREKLQKAAGSGKMGLRQDLTADEANELADAIAEMRGLLVDEVESGIPAASPPDASSTSSSSSSGSKYQDLLAKARAEKEAKNKEQ